MPAMIRNRCRYQCRADHPTARSVAAGDDRNRATSSATLDTRPAQIKTAKPARPAKLDTAPPAGQRLDVIPRPSDQTATPTGDPHPRAGHPFFGGSGTVHH